MIILGPDSLSGENPEVKEVTMKDTNNPTSQTVSRDNTQRTKI